MNGGTLFQLKIKGGLRGCSKEFRKVDNTEKTYRRDSLGFLSSNWLQPKKIKINQRGDPLTT